MGSKIYGSLPFGTNVKIVSKNQTIQNVIDNCDSPSVSNSFVIQVPPGHETEFYVQVPYVDIRFVDGTPSINPLILSLNAGLSGALQIISDSTGNDTSEWVYLLGNYFATAYSNLTVYYHLWSDWNSKYNPAVIMQTGTDGVRYLTLDGNGHCRLNRDGFAGVTEDLDIRFRLDGSWRPAANASLSLWYGIDGRKSFSFKLLTGGDLDFYWSDNGTNLFHETSSVAISDAITDPLWIRVTMDVDNGAADAEVKFYTSTNDVNESKSVTTWTQLGTTRMVGNTTSIYSGVGMDIQPLEAGGQSWTEFYIGDIYAMEIYGEIDGSVPLHSLSLDSWYRYKTGQVMHGSPVLNIINGSRPGGNYAYFTLDSTREAQMLPNYGQLYTYISTSHNEETSIEEAWINKVANYDAVVRNLLPLSNIAYVLQNPETSGKQSYLEHAKRQMQLAAWAKNNKADIVDVYKEFAQRGTTDYLSDSVHPNSNGHQLYLNKVISLLNIT